MAKSKPEVTEFTSSKTGKLRDPRATMKLSLGVAFAKTARIAAQRQASLIATANGKIDKVLARAAKRV